MSQDIFVLAEHMERQVADITFEMLGKAKALARATGGRAVAVLLGSGVDSLARQLGAADVVLVADDPRLAGFSPDACKKALGAIVRERRPRLLLIANTTMGMDVAAGLSAELDLPLAAYCNDVRLDGGSIVAVSQVYGGKLNAETELDGESGIVSVLAGAFPADAGRQEGAPPVEKLPAVGLDPIRVRFRRLIVPEAADVDITREKILVSVGRGIQDAANLELVEALARALGGAVAASRPIVDNKWLPKARQVGKSGVKVKPKLYLAVGISGAPEHLEGMKDSELIIAINTDPNAPIFDVAHYGVTADLFDVVPALTEKLRSGGQV